MNIRETDIALIGMAGRFPGASNVRQYWQNLKHGVASITFFTAAELQAAGVDPALLRDPHYVKAKGVVEGDDLFDAAFFGISPGEAELMDPQHRLFLETAWAALEDAGYIPDRCPGSVGVYAGAGANTYWMINLCQRYPHAAEDFQLRILNDNDYLTTRVSYSLNLKGPSMNVQAACATSLVAIHAACQSLLAGECDMAIAGGAAIQSRQKTGYLHKDGMVYSPDGHCRTFDARAEGTVRGNGVGAVILKPLAKALTDGDHVYAVIRGSAVTNDGTGKLSFSAPSSEGQAAAIAEALALADVDPATVGYVEAHGTATVLGDPIEVAGLTLAFGPGLAPATCALGSVKPNIGHLDAAAGVAGLIKTALAVKEGLLPPTLHFETPNPRIDFAAGPFYVNDRLRPWPANGQPRRAGISSFAVGGTNCHLVLEEPPARPEPAGPQRPWHLVPLSGQSPAQVDTLGADLAAHLRQHPDLPLADVAFTLQAGRKPFRHRRFVVASDTADLAAALATADPTRVMAGEAGPALPVVFMFPGHGGQHPGMGAGTYLAEPVFREVVDQCAAFLLPHLGFYLRDLLLAPDAEAARRLEHPAVAQPALFVIEYALARTWLAYGIKPAALIGHSFGEYVAACLAGVIALEDALWLVAERGRIASLAPAGAMLAVMLPEAQVLPLLGADLSLALVNGPAMCVVGGSCAAIDELEARLTREGSIVRRLRSTHAFHSHLLDPILDEFAAKVRTVTLRPPQMPYLSCVTGTWITAAEATDPAYWVRHLRQTVRFADGLATLLGQGEYLLLEVGPGRMLTGFAAQHPGAVAIPSLPHATDPTPDYAFLLGTLGQLWLAGQAPDWGALYGEAGGRRVPLPTYPFNRRRYWVEAGRDLPLTAPPPVALSAETETPQTPLPQQKAAPAAYPRPDLSTPYAEPTNTLERRMAEIWQEAFRISPIGLHDDFFQLGGHSLMAIQLLTRLRESFPTDLPLSSLFACTTVASLAEEVESRLLDRLEALSDEEVAQLLHD